MKIVVLGAGVVGTTTAWYLAQAGHQVVVLERQPGPALETSYANAGQISPGYSAPWAGPGVPVKAIKWMFMEHAPLVIRARVNPAMWRWMWQMLMNCNAKDYELNKSRMMRLAEYSRDRFVALRAETGIAYDDRQQGTLQLFRTQKQLDGIGGDVLERGAGRERDVVGLGAARERAGHRRSALAGRHRGRGGGATASDHEAGDEQRAHGEQPTTAGPRRLTLSGPAC